MRKIRKITLVLIIFLVGCLLLGTKVYAEGESTENPSNSRETGADEQVEKATNTDFTNAKLVIKDMDFNFAQNENERSYIEANVEINNITRDLNNESFEYFWFVSLVDNESNITNWVKITEPQTVADKLTFKVSTLSVNNASRFIFADKAYLYIKEVATKGEDTETIVSNSIVLDRNQVEEPEQTDNNVLDENQVAETKKEDLKAETYSQSGREVENPKASSILEEENTQKSEIATSSKKQETSTKSKSSLPYTGTETRIILFIVITVIFSVIAYKRYKKISQFVK